MQLKSFKFIIVNNDDIFRYVDSYGKLIASTLNEIELLDDDNINDVIGATTELINSKKIDNEDRRTLLNILAKDLTESNIERISKSGIKLKGFTKEKKARQQVQISAKDNFDLFNESLDQVGSSDNSEDKLNEIMALYSSENRSIWFNNYSKSLDLAKNNVKKLLGAEGEAIKKLKSQVLAFNAEYWEICREIIWFLEGKFNTLQVKEIYKIIIAHFNYIIRPDEEVRQKYSWIKTVVDPISNDDLIADLIIWNLNHPEHSTVLRTKDTLRELAIFYPPIIIALFKECILNKPEPSGELSSKILKKISRGYSPLLRKILVENPFIIDEVDSIQNFLIKKNLLEVGINLNRIGYKELYEKINCSIPNAKILTGEVFFEEEHLVAIQDYIDDLNSELLLNEEFCKNVNKLLDEYCYPLDKSEVKKSDRYLRRSFFNDQGIAGRYNFFAKHALNNAISSRVAKDNIDKIYEIVNS